MVGEDEEYKDESDAILKIIGAEEDQDSDSIFAVYLFLKFSSYFGEELISNIFYLEFAN